MIVNMKMLFGDFAMDDQRVAPELKTQIRVAIDAGEQVELDFACMRAIVSALLEELVPTSADEEQAAILDRLLIVRNASPTIAATIAAIRNRARHKAGTRPRRFP